MSKISYYTAEGLKKLKDEYPTHNIKIFTSNLPPNNHDDLSTFDLYLTSLSVLVILCLIDGCKLYIAFSTSLILFEALLKPSSDKFVLVTTI